MIVIVVPTPRPVSSLIAPPSLWILVLTTSIPTPRPEISVTASAVLTPAPNINMALSLSVIWASWFSSILPLLKHLATTLSVSIPAPSSSIVIIIWPFACSALIVIEPVSSFPVLNLSSGDSKPWSREFLIICIKGSVNPSIIALSISTLSPWCLKSIFLPSFLEISLTTFGNFE